VEIKNKPKYINCFEIYKFLYDSRSLSQNINCPLSIRKSKMIEVITIFCIQLISQGKLFSVVIKKRTCVDI